MESMNNNGGEGQEGERKAGLVNMSNTCFMNAVIQSLLFTPIFSHHFLSRKSLVSTGAGGSPGSGGVSRVSGEYFSEFVLPFLRGEKEELCLFLCSDSLILGPTTRSSSSRFEKNSNFGANQEIVNPINVELAQLFSTLRSGTVSLVEPESLYNSICKSLPAFYGFQQHVWISSPSVLHSLFSDPFPFSKRMHKNFSDIFSMKSTKNLKIIPIPSSPPPSFLLMRKKKKAKKKVKPILWGKLLKIWRL